MSLPADAPPALTQVAQRYEVTSRGVVGFRMQKTFDVHAGFRRRREELALEGVYNDGAIVKVRVLNYTIDGKPASAADRSTLVQEWEHPRPGNAFAPPFDPRNFGAYSYRSAGAQTIAFSSTVNDRGHGNGSFTYDGAGNVVSLTYHPNVLPPHANFGRNRGSARPGARRFLGRHPRSASVQRSLRDLRGRGNGNDELLGVSSLPQLAFRTERDVGKSVRPGPRAERRAGIGPGALSRGASGSSQQALQATQKTVETGG